MKKLLLLAGLLLTACSQTTQTTHQRDFNFKYSYGVKDGRAQNEINTFNDTLTRDMVLASPVTVTMVLSDAEMKTIQEEIDKLDLFGEAPKGDTRVSSDPCSTYRLQVDYGIATGVMVWDCEDDTGDRATFSEFMWNFIQTKDEFKALPEPQGGYM